MPWVFALIAAAVPLWPLTAWSQFRHNIGNNAVVRGNLDASWRVKTGGTYSASPAEVGGVVYLGSNDGNLFAIDAANGRVLWTFHAKAALMTNPLVYGSSVIVGEGNQTSYVNDAGNTKVGTSENAIIAVDRGSGKEQWRVPLKGTGMPTPALMNGTVVEHDGIGDVTGIDVKTGHVLYRTQIGGAASMVSMLPVAATRFVTASVSPNSVWEVDASTGRVLWQHQFPDDASGLSDCPPAGDGKRVFCDYAAPPPGVDRAHVGAPAVERLFALDQNTGAVLWNIQFAAGLLPQWNEAAIPLVYHRTLFVGSSLEPQIAAVNPVNGRILWRRQVRGVVKSGMCGKDGVIYAGDYSGYLWAIDARNGSVIGVKNMHTIFNVGSPLIAGNTLIAGTNTGDILAVPLAEIRSSHDG